MAELKNEYWICMREDMGKDKQRFLPIAKVRAVMKGANGKYCRVDKKTVLL